MSRFALVVDQLDAVRKYTLSMLDNVEPSAWLMQPKEGVSHIAWQIGHLAVSEYWLALNRIRGRHPDDEELVSEKFVQRYGRLSTPDPSPANNLTAAELRAVLDRVHGQALKEIRMLSDAQLDEPVPKPHRQFTTKLGALLWCAQHEMIHVGQIGLLRRLLGMAPLW